jgi:hypothetical protein
MPIVTLFAPYLAPLVLIVAVAWFLAPVRSVLPAILSRADARGWLAVGCFALVIFVMVLVAVGGELRKDDLFKMLAQGLVLTAFIGLVLGLYFTAQKGDPVKPATPPVLPPEPPAT